MTIVFNCIVLMLYLFYNLLPSHQVVSPHRVLPRFAPLTARCGSRPTLRHTSLATRFDPWQPNPKKGFPGSHSVFCLPLAQLYLQSCHAHGLSRLQLQSDIRFSSTTVLSFASSGSQCFSSRPTSFISWPTLHPSIPFVCRSIQHHPRQEDTIVVCLDSTTRNLFFFSKLQPASVCDID